MYNILRSRKPTSHTQTQSFILETTITSNLQHYVCILLYVREFGYVENVFILVINMSDIEYICAVCSFGESIALNVGISGIHTILAMVGMVWVQTLFELFNTACNLEIVSRRTVCFTFKTCFKRSNVNLKGVITIYCTLLFYLMSNFTHRYYIVT